MCPDSRYGPRAVRVLERDRKRNGEQHFSLPNVLLVHERGWIAEGRDDSGEAVRTRGRCVHSRSKGGRRQCRGRNARRGSSWRSMRTRDRLSAVERNLSAVRGAEPKIGVAVPVLLVEDSAAL